MKAGGWIVLVRAEVGPFTPDFYYAWLARKNAKNAALGAAAVIDRHPEAFQNLSDFNIRSHFRCVKAEGAQGAVRGSHGLPFHYNFK